MLHPSANGASGTGLTVGQVVTIFLSHSTGVSRATIDRNRIIEQFVADFGTSLVSDLRPVDLIFWVAARKKWKSDWTKRNVIHSIVRPLNWAVRLGIIDRNPLAHVSHPEGEPGEPMNEWEYRAILRLSDAWFRRASMFMFFQGCRTCEMRELEWSFIDWKLGVAIIRRHKTAKTRKDRKPRVLVLHPVTLRLLQWMRAKRFNERFVFTNRFRRPWNSACISTRMKRIRRIAGIRPGCSLYGLRHLFGSNAVLNGVDIRTISELMGHTNTRTTERYTHISGQLTHLRSATIQAVKEWKFRGDL